MTSQPKNFLETILPRAPPPMAPRPAGSTTAATKTTSLNRMNKALMPLKETTRVRRDSSTRSVC